MSTRRLRREVERLADQSGIREAEVEAAEERHWARYLAQGYVMKTNEMPPPEGPSEGLEPDLVRDLTWASELLADDTAEKWRADHELLEAYELEKHGSLDHVERRKAWGASPDEFIQRMAEQWMKCEVPELRRKWRRHVETEMWRQAPDGLGQTMPEDWRDRHRERLDREVDDGIDLKQLLRDVKAFEERDREEYRRQLARRAAE